VISGNDIGAQSVVPNRVQIFREVVGNVQVGTDVRNEKLTLSNAVSYPMKTHIDGFGTFLLDGVRGDADSAGVIAHEYGRRLRMPEVSKDGPKTGSVLCSGKQGGIFSFTSASHDAGDNGGEGVAPLILRGRLWSPRKR
jgi:hypothetical protein